MKIFSKAAALAVFLACAISSIGPSALAPKALAQEDRTAEFGFDPVTTDPVVVDRQFPPTTVKLEIESHEATMYGFIYMAQGKGPHPNLVLLHGFPGFEQNLDLAQALRRTGFNVLTFHYRGSWGSEGTYSILNAREDVAAAIRVLRNKDTPSAERIDASRIGIIGHSMGGFLALQGAALDPEISCIGALAPANMGVMANAARTNPGYRTSLEEESGQMGPVRAVKGIVLVEELLSNPEFDTVTLGPKLAPRPLLLIGGSGDTVLPYQVFHTPLAVAWQDLDWPKLKIILMDGDNSFSWNRMTLARHVTDWARQNCTGPAA